ncbi:MAG: hypothetical protein ACREBA_11675 [Nitrosotalea sp.]
MSIHLQNFRNGFYKNFCRFYGLNLGVVRGLVEEITREIDPQPSTHLSIQTKEFQNWNNPSSEYLSPESYFVDWCYSSMYDTKILETGLTEIVLKEISFLNETTTEFCGIKQEFELKYHKESQFITRILYRKVHEEKLAKPDAPQKELLETSIQALKDALDKDKKTREANKTAKLTFFTACPSVQSKLLIKCGKTISIQVAAVVISMFFFSTLHVSKRGEYSHFYFR